MKILIDPGHGGLDSGAIGINNVKEEVVNLRIANRVFALLNFYHDVRLTRQYSQLNYCEELKLSDRVNMAKIYDLFISIHCNSFCNVNVNGIEIYCYPGSNVGQIVAEKILNSILATVPALTGYSLTNRGIKDGSDLFVIRQTICPAVLIECGFLSNLEECKLLTSPIGEIAYGAAIAAALL